VDIALCTAMAGEMLGLKLIYLDAGSGALNAVSREMIKEVSSRLHVPLVVGGGIKNSEEAIIACEAGADIVVIGNAIEKNPALIGKISKAIHEFNTLNISL
jgi:putative glycerol-1-phosphate prenyltransferase